MTRKGGGRGAYRGWDGWIISMGKTAVVRCEYGGMRGAPGGGGGRCKCVCLGGALGL